MKTREYARWIRVGRQTGCLLLLFTVTALELWMVCHCGRRQLANARPVDHSLAQVSVPVNLSVSDPMFPVW